MEVVMRCVPVVLGCAICVCEMFEMSGDVWS